LQSDEVYNKETQELIKLFNDVSAQSDSRYNIGLRQLVTLETQGKLATQYLGVVREETRFRNKMENDILKDV
jgi:hypothetical protein